MVPVSVVPVRPVALFVVLITLSALDLLLVCLALLVVFAAAQPAAPPADAPAAAPADAPALAPADAPMNAPTDAPVVAPADAPALAPVEAPADSAPLGAPADAPVAAPQLAPVAAPVQAPVEPSLCDANGCSFAMAVATANISFGGSLGAAYSPRCIRISAGDTVTWDSSSANAFAVHPLRGGTVQGSLRLILLLFFFLINAQSLILSVLFRKYCYSC